MTSSLETSNRRLVPDRRARPTPLWGTFRMRGRRCGFRREGERRNSYVDRLSIRVVLLSLSIVILSFLDAGFTLLHLELGGWEVNPLMRLALVSGIPFFLTVKICLTGVGVVFLAAHQNFRLSWVALRCVAAVYLWLLAYHIYLYGAGRG